MAGEPLSGAVPVRATLNTAVCPSLRVAKSTDTAKSRTVAAFAGIGKVALCSAVSLLRDTAPPPVPTVGDAPKVTTKSSATSAVPSCTMPMRSSPTPVLAGIVRLFPVSEVRLKSIAVTSPLTV